MISITDGQIFLESDLFYSGVRPAINVGISVSRVGGNAQTKAMKKVAGHLRLDLAQYRELEAFAQFGSELDPAPRRRSPAASGWSSCSSSTSASRSPVEDQVAAIYAGTGGFLDGSRPSASASSSPTCVPACTPSRRICWDGSRRRAALRRG